jgi:hypothetical protein
MHRDIRLPSIFADNNICTLDGFALQETVTPSRTVGGAWFSTQLSPMKERVLRLHLDGFLHSFIEARKNIRYDDALFPLPNSCAPRVIAIRRIQTRRAVTLLLIDEKLEKPIAVIGDTIAWEPGGLDVRLVCGRDEALL